MKKRLLLLPLILTAIATSMVACGQKGPLYLPERKDTPPQAGSGFAAPTPTNPNAERPATSQP